MPLLEEGGVEAFLEREVLPYAPDAWYDPASIKIGYEISFTREFYKPQPLRSLEEIRADILALERETEGLMAEIVGESGVIERLAEPYPAYRTRESRGWSRSRAAGMSTRRRRCFVEAMMSGPTPDEQLLSRDSSRDGVVAAVETAIVTMFEAEA